MATTVAPKNLQIKRENNQYQISWNIGDKDYGDGQQAQYKWNNESWKNWGSSSDIGKATTSKKVTIPVTSLYPYTSKKIQSFSVRVRGNRKKYNETQKKKGKSKTVTINPGWSSWTEKTVTMIPPLNRRTERALTVTEEWASSSANVCKMNWAYTISDSSNDMFTRFEWQTALVENYSTTDGTTITWEASVDVNKVSGTDQSGNHSFTETTSTIRNGSSWARWFRIRARGPGGDSEWSYGCHVYGDSHPATNVQASANVGASNTEVWLDWDTLATSDRPIDTIKVQYVMTVPAEGLTCPAGASWTDASSYAYGNGEDRDRVVVPDTPGQDECLFVRVTTIHDERESPGEAILSGVGKLKAPTVSSFSTDDSQYKATITATNNSEVPGSFLAIIYQGSKEPDKSFIVGVIPDGYTSATVQAPDWSDEDAVGFGVFAFVGTYTKQTREDGVDVYTLTSPRSDFTMQSDTEWKGGTIPKAPENVNVTVKDGEKGIVRVTWDWSWPEATGAELSWADHDDAWESTDEPDTFSVSNLHASHWNIAGLSSGTTWYIRVRFFQESEDNTTYGPYSAITSASTIDLSSAPDEPALAVSPAVVSRNGTFTASWSYVSNDNTDQRLASVCEVTVENNETVYTEIGRVTTAQHIDFDVAELGWTVGSQHNLALKVYSESGNESDWSQLVPVTVADAVTCSITSTSLENVTVTEDGDDETTRTVLSLTEMPLSVAVSGAGNDKTTTLVIERATSFFAETPDENSFNGYENETIYLSSMMGAGSFSVGLTDLIGTFNDGAAYRMTATVEDGYGQKAQAQIDFEVHWSHQAMEIAATCFMDSVADFMPVSVIIAEEPEDAEEGDYIQIYRLSADKPVLVVDHGDFDTYYVDPYPTIGEHGGHRVVFLTANGDYITEDSTFAWTDLSESQDDILDIEKALIDFAGRQIQLAYNIDLSSSWEKDFEETHYLGGSIQGDWNPGVSRSGSVSTVMITLTDADGIRDMRRLAEHEGVCRLRTQDGSNLWVNIDVSEKRSHQQGGKVVSFDLSIARVDPQEVEGMLYTEWLDSLVYLLDEYGNNLTTEHGAYILGDLRE